MLVRLCTLGPTQLLTRLFAGRTGPKPMWISVPRETAHPSLHTAMARTAHRLVWLAMVGSVYCTLPDAARATGRAAPAADRRRPAQLQPVEIHRPTIAPTSLRRAERGARAAQITPHRRAITDADAAPPRQRPNALHELSPTSPSCSPSRRNPTHSSLPQLHLPPRGRAAGARRPKCFLRYSPPLPGDVGPAPARSSSRSRAVCGLDRFDRRGRGRRSRSPLARAWAGEVDQRRGSDLCLRSRGAGT